MPFYSKTFDTSVRVLEIVQFSGRHQTCFRMKASGDPSVIFLDFLYESEGNFSEFHWINEIGNLF